MPDLESQVRAFVEKPGTDFDAALIVAQIIEPDISLEQASVAMAMLSDTFDSGSTNFADGLCKHMQHQGFQGATDGFYDLDNSRIDQVLANRRGIPISLAVIYLELARRRNVPACGINFPAHFLIEVDEQLIDPFAGTLTSREACLSQLKQTNIDPMAAFSPTTPVQLMMRMLNNVRGVHASQGRFSDALCIIDHQLVLYPDQPELYLGRAELWWRLGSADAARHELDRALRHGANPDMVANIRAQLGPESPTVH